MFDAKSWGALMSRSILPKLGAGLATLQINPAFQPPESLAPWNDAMAWAPYLAAGQVRIQRACSHSFPADEVGRRRRWRPGRRHGVGASPGARPADPQRCEFVSTVSRSGQPPSSFAPWREAMAIGLTWAPAR